jgi:hypothetical protein
MALDLGACVCALRSLLAEADKATAGPWNRDASLAIDALTLLLESAVEDARRAVAV